MSTIIAHPTSRNAQNDRMNDRENLARQLRTTQMMREMAREQINPTDLISQIHVIDAELQGEKDAAGNPIPLEREILAALRARADIKFRLLSKVLPDLKQSESISHSTHDHQHLVATTNVSNMELAQRLQLFRRDHQEIIVEARTTIEEEVPAPEGGYDWL